MAQKEFNMTSVKLPSIFIIFATPFAFGLLPASEASAKNETLKGAVIGAGVGGLIGGSKGAVIGGVGGAIIGSSKK